MLTAIFTREWPKHIHIQLAPTVLGFNYYTEKNFRYYVLFYFITSTHAHASLRLTARMS